MKNIIFLTALFFFISSCKKEKFTIENLNGNRIIALGHAGMGADKTYPMNSYESILKCLNIGMDGAEMDVQMTKDSVLVAYHDQELSQNTNLKGFINSMNWNELKHQGHYIQTPYLNYSIISLEELFSNIDNLHKYKYSFDCKLHTENKNISQFYETYINALINIIQKYQIQDNIYIESQSIEFLAAFKNKRPDYRLFINRWTFELGLDIALSLGLYGVSISTRNITREQIGILHDYNLFVVIWDVHSKSDNVEAIRKNPDFIQTDNPKALLKLLK